MKTGDSDLGFVAYGVNKVILEDGSDKPNLNTWKAAEVSHVKLNADGSVDLAIRVSFQVDDSQVLKLMGMASGIAIAASDNIVRTYLRSYGPSDGETRFLKWAAQEQARQEAWK